MIKDILFWFLMAFIVAPSCVYLMVKFGATGYFRAKERAREKLEKKTRPQI